MTKTKKVTKRRKGQLAPCPFCGGKAICGLTAIFCGTCHVQWECDSGAHTDKEELYSFWNTRANKD